MGDEYGRDACFVVQCAQPYTQLLANFRVERAEGLIEQQHARLYGQCARERDALALAARKLARVALAQPIKLNQIQQFLDAPGDLGTRWTLAAAANLKAKGDVLRHCHMTEERVLLEHEACAALARRDRQPVQTVERHLADIGEFEPSEDAQQRGLARAGGTEQRNESTLRSLEAHSVQRRKAAELLGYGLDDKSHWLIFPNAGEQQRFRRRSATRERI